MADGGSVQSDEEPADEYDVTVNALSTRTTQIISAFLNPIKIVPTSEGLPRYWQGLAELIGITGENLPHLQTHLDPTKRILQIWHERDKKQSTIRNLINYLERLDRYDVIDDIADYLGEDVKKFAESASNNCAPLDLQTDRCVLTVDDINRINQGLEPQNYDAFVLFAEDDIDFATELIETMEKQKNLKFCVKDRDLVGGAFEHEVIIQLIAKRCNRLIVIISASFFQSSANRFFVSFAQVIGIDQRIRKIIPCIYRHCEIPTELRCYFMLDFTRTGKLYNFWDKLYESIRSPERQTPKKNSLNRSASHQVRPTIKINCFPTVNRHVSNLTALKPRKEGVVTFSSMVNLTDPNSEPQLSPSASMTTVAEKKHKSKSWFKKLLPHKSSKSTNGNLQEKEKRRFWQRHSKQKVAVAN